MDTTGPERYTLANPLLEFVQQLRHSTFVLGAERFLCLSGLTVRNGSLSFLPLKLPPSTRITISLRGQCISKLISSGYGV